MVMGNRDWNRVESELRAGILRNHEQGSRHSVNERGEGSKVSKTDNESILKHIEEALQGVEESI
jgi:hypothetical protein